MTGLADGAVPVSSHESIFTLLVMLLGIGIFATIIGAARRRASAAPRP